MRVLQLGNTDLVGARFNGHDLHLRLKGRGVASSHCVWIKDSTDPDTWELSTFRYRWLLNDAFAGRIERRLSLQSLLYPFAFGLPLDARFRSADVVHAHLLHAGFFSLFTLPMLSRMRPFVWTLHDPWAMTGHCIHPFGCARWEEGCGDCPRLDIPQPLAKDRTAFLWKAKRFLYGASRADIVVASRWMLAMAQRSPLLAGFRLHHIPFGLDLDVFRPGDREAAKRKLGVFPGSVVLGFRAVRSEFKGLPLILDVLRRLDADRPVCLVTFNERGLVDEFRGRFQIIDLGWVDDERAAVDAYNAMDLFLMPSSAEAFGMMAMEAMASGTTVIACEGTSLPEVLFAPAGGVTVPQGDAEALRSAVESLLADPDARLAIGRAARALAVEHYDIRLHVDRMIALYEDVVARRKGKNR
ncbi:MAG TPA: glycosyltransferase [Candidatus Deferrimicrobiaceae bacterium]